MKLHCKNSLICSVLLFTVFSITNGITVYPNIDCLTETISTFVSHKDVLNSNMTYGYTVTLTSTYPICYHDSAYGLSIMWDTA